MTKTEHMSALFKNAKGIALSLASFEPLDFAAALSTLTPLTDAVILYKGTAFHLPEYYKCPVALQLTLNSTQIANAEDAIAVGADGCIASFYSSKEESVALFSKIERSCRDFSLPIFSLCMDKNTKQDLFASQTLGADGAIVSFSAELKEILKKLYIPVLVSIDEMDVKKILSIAKDAVSFGASGVVLQSSFLKIENPELAIKALRAVVHENYSVEKALDYLENLKKGKHSIY